MHHHHHGVYLSLSLREEVNLIFFFFDGVLLFADKQVHMVE